MLFHVGFLVCACYTVSHLSSRAALFRCSTQLLQFLSSSYFIYWFIVLIFQPPFSLGCYCHFFQHMCVHFASRLCTWLFTTEWHLTFSPILLFLFLCLFIDYMFYYLSFFLFSLCSYRWVPLFPSPAPVRNFHTRNVPLPSSIDAYTLPSLLPPGSTLLAGTTLLSLYSAPTLSTI